MSVTCILVDERKDGLYLSWEDETGIETSEPTKWLETKDRLHSVLGQRGYKRFGKQKHSNIGGVYVRSDSQH